MFTWKLRNDPIGRLRIFLRWVAKNHQLQGGPPTIARSGVIIPSETQLLTRPFMGTPWTPITMIGSVGAHLGATLAEDMWSSHFARPLSMQRTLEWRGEGRLVPWWPWSWGKTSWNKGAPPRCLGICKGWDPTQLCGDYFINHDKDPY